MGNGEKCQKQSANQTGDQLIQLDKHDFGKMSQKSEEKNKDMQQEKKEEKCKSHQRPTGQTSRQVAYRTHVSMVGFSDHLIRATNYIVFGLFNIKARAIFVQIFGEPFSSSLLILHEVHNPTPCVA